MFKSETDRNLWLRLNAEHQIEGDLNSGCSNALHPRTMEQALKIAENQLEFDEERGELRVTLDEYLTLDFKQINEIRERQVIKLFENALRR